MSESIRSALFGLQLGPPDALQAVRVVEDGFKSRAKAEKDHSGCRYSTAYLEFCMVVRRAIIFAADIGPIGRL